MAAVVVLAACSGGVSAAPASPPAETDAVITADNLAFDTPTLTVPSGTPFELYFRNLEGAPHNVAIYTDASASEPIFVGEVINEGAILYAIPALEPGEHSSGATCTRR